jgi:hypothetical protein
LPKFSMLILGKNNDDEDDEASIRL